MHLYLLEKSCSQPNDDGNKQEPLQTIIIVTVCIIIFITVIVCICYACKRCKNSYSPVLPRVNSS